MGMIIGGIVLIVAAVAGFVYMRMTKRELQAMIGTETLSIPELEELRGISDGLGARGGFRKVAEVVGAAHPRPEGPIVSEISKTECVWFRYEVIRHYEYVEYRDNRRTRRKGTEKVTNFTSRDGYAVIDQQGRTIGVDPNGTKPDAAEQTVSRFEPHDGRQQVEFFGIRLPAFTSDGTIGFEYKEWLIRPGQRMYVLGEVHDKIGPLVIAKPQGGEPYIISTRTEEELRRARTQRHQLLAAGVVLAFLAGVAVLVVGIIK